MQVAPISFSNLLHSIRLNRDMAAYILATQNTTQRNYFSLPGSYYIISNLLKNNSQEHTYKHSDYNLSIIAFFETKNLTINAQVFLLPKISFYAVRSDIYFLSDINGKNNVCDVRITRYICIVLINSVNSPDLMSILRLTTLNIAYFKDCIRSFLSNLLCFTFVTWKTNARRSHTFNE